MSYQQPAASPNVEKLFHYLQKNQWHNVSAHFSGFVRREFESHLDKLEQDEETYKNLKLMIEYSEMGRFSEAKNMINTSYKEYQQLLNNLTELKLNKNTHRRVATKPVQNQESYNTREHHTTDVQETSNRSANQRQGTPQRTQTPKRTETPQRTQTPQRNPQPQVNPGYGTPNIQDMINRNPRTPQYQHEQQSYDPHKDMTDRNPRTPQYQHEQQSYDPHKENYDNLRLKTPERPPNSYVQQQPPNRYDSPRNMTPVDHDNRPNSYHHGSRTPPASGVQTSAGQMTSSKALWGQEHGDRPSEKVGSSTYRHDFPTYPVDIHERKDKDRYRENFGSLAERDIYRGSEEGSYHDDQRRGGSQSRHLETPDHENRPSELARKFKELYSTEWTDAYDEVCKDFGSEKTVRHLLWIVTEASLIANDAADHQLKDLEKQAFGVMTSSGERNEAWLISGDVAYKQLKDLEKASLDLMTTPSQEHHGGYVPNQLGDTISASRSLLLKYRKQTAPLSIPSVKKECRDRISKTLMESFGFLKSYLGDASRLTAYIYKCAELTWLMCVQDPPIVLEYITKETEGARFNHDHYHVYTKSGNTYDFGVWPMLRIGDKGHILSKGIAQGI